MQFDSSQKQIDSFDVRVNNKITKLSGVARFVGTLIDSELEQ